MSSVLGTKRKRQTENEIPIDMPKKKKRRRLRSKSVSLYTDNDQQIDNKEKEIDDQKASAEDEKIHDQNVDNFSDDASDDWNDTEFIDQTQLLIVNEHDAFTKSLYYDQLLFSELSYQCKHCGYVFFPFCKCVKKHLQDNAHESNTINTYISSHLQTSLQYHAAYSISETVPYDILSLHCIMIVNERNSDIIFYNSWIQQLKIFNNLFTVKFIKTITNVSPCPKQFIKLLFLYYCRQSYIIIYDISNNAFTIHSYNDNEINEVNHTILLHDEQQKQIKPIDIDITYNNDGLPILVALDNAKLHFFLFLRNDINELNVNDNIYTKYYETVHWYTQQLSYYHEPFQMSLCPHYHLTDELDKTKTDANYQLNINGTTINTKTGLVMVSMDSYQDDNIHLTENPSASFVNTASYGVLQIDSSRSAIYQHAQLTVSCKLQPMLILRIQDLRRAPSELFNNISTFDQIIYDTNLKRFIISAHFHDNQSSCIIIVQEIIIIKQIKDILKQFIGNQKNVIHCILQHLY